MDSPKKNINNVDFGDNVKIYDFVNIYGCKIGDNTQIGPFVEIQKGSDIGKNCKISTHTFICEGVKIRDNCFIGHGVMFINDKKPKATNLDGNLQDEDDWTCIPTYVEKNASIGSNATILCGVTIGENSLVGAGAVVTRDVPPNTIVVGNPAKVLRKINRKED